LGCARRAQSGRAMLEKKILVADDESHILHVVSLKLRNAGFTVVTACDGQEAFDLTQQELPDLLIIDYHMPHLNGMEVCERLRRIPATEKIPAIMLTARGYELDADGVQSHGIVRMLSKPFSPRHLLATVNEVLAEFGMPPAEGHVAEVG
jgi:two-component system, OmpR family, alkaline phosphatase synthesis response regulator PhoP